MDQPKSKVAIKDFPGLYVGPDPIDIPTGAAVIQINVGSGKPGKIITRKGYCRVTFEADE